MDHDEFDAWFCSRVWVVAKRYVETWPHEYTSRKPKDPPEVHAAFERAVVHVRIHGVKRKFFRPVRGAFIWITASGEFGRWAGAPSGPW
jgi:hypothetical protein